MEETVPLIPENQLIKTGWQKRVQWNEMVKNKKLEILDVFCFIAFYILLRPYFIFTP